MTRSLAVLLALALAASFQPAPSFVKGQAVLQAAGGTINAGSPQIPLGTLVLFMWNVESEQSEGFSFMLRGPAGWNADAPHLWRVSRRGTGSMLDKAIRTIPAVMGEYALSTMVGTNEASAKFPIDVSSPLTRPSVRASSSRGTITVSWTAVPNVLSYEVYLQSIQRADFVLPMGDTPASQTSLQIVLGGLPSGRYQAMVFAYTFNVRQSPSAITTLPQQVNASIGSGEFSFP